MVPELRREDDTKTEVLTTEFSSEDNVVDFQGTLALLRKHRMMVEDVENVDAELLR
jgi:hypothetical protein